MRYIFPTEVNCSLFADFLKISVNYISNVGHSMQISFDNLSEWLDQWDLKPAMHKCTTMYILNNNH